MTAKPPPLRDVALVALGGAIGATFRVAFATWFPVTDGAYPWTTFVENVLGAFALAFALRVLIERVAVGRAVRLLFCTGVLGAFTTYSALAVEVDRLTAGGHLHTGTAYAAGSVIAGLLAAIAGLRLGRGWARRAGARSRRGGPR